MFKSRRNRIEINAEILRAARQGARTSRIVYNTNLNFVMFTEYRQRLEKAGLLRRGPDGIIKTTEKGQEYLQRFYALITIGGLQAW